MAVLESHGRKVFLSMRENDQGKDRAQRLFDFARSKNALPFVQYSILACDNLEKRAEQTRTLLEGSERIYGELSGEILDPGCNPASLVPRAKQLHYSVLDALEKICVLAETLFTTLAAIKRDYRRLPFATLRQSSPWPEVAWAKNSKIKELRNLLLIPVPSAVFKSRERRNVLRRTLGSAIPRIAQTLRGTASFYQRFVQIFNKYKHTLSEHVGYTEIVETPAGRELVSIIFFEDYPHTKKRKLKKRSRPRPYTWGIVVSTSLFRYLQETLRQLIALHTLFLVTYLTYLHNEGRPFITSIGDFLQDTELQQLREAANQEPTFRSIAQVGMAINISWDPKIRLIAAKRALRGHGVFRLSRHIFRGKKATTMADIKAEMK
jgi:hypothetical protein